MYTEIFSQMKKQLGQLDKWLGTAEEFAKAKGFDPGIVLGFRLAPDQFPFAQQVQTACDTAKLAAFRLTGKAAETPPIPRQRSGSFARALGLSSRTSTASQRRTSKAQL